MQLEIHHQDLQVLHENTLPRAPTIFRSRRYRRPKKKTEDVTLT